MPYNTTLREQHRIGAITRTDGLPMRVPAQGVRSPGGSSAVGTLARVVPDPPSDPTPIGPMAVARMDADGRVAVSTIDLPAAARFSVAGAAAPWVVLDPTDDAPSGRSAATVDGRGRLRLPAGVRHRLALAPGDQVVVALVDDGTLAVAAAAAAVVAPTTGATAP